MTEAKAKIFWSGRSQAVRLPKEFRFDANEVSIRREGNAVILEAAPPQDDDWAWVSRVAGKFSEDAIQAIEELRAEPPQERPELDKLFK